MPPRLTPGPSKDRHQAPTAPPATDSPSPGGTLAVPPAREGLAVRQDGERDGMVGCRVRSGEQRPAAPRSTLLGQPGQRDAKLAGGVGEGQQRSLLQLPVLFMKEKNIISICFLFQIKSILGQKYAFHFTMLASPSVWTWPSPWVAAAAATAVPAARSEPGRGQTPGAPPALASPGRPHK